MVHDLTVQAAESPELQVGIDQCLVQPLDGLAGRLELEVGRLELLVGRPQLLVRRLELLVGRLQLLVARLELLVARLELLVARHQLLVGRLELLVGRLELLVHVTEALPQLDRAADVGEGDGGAEATSFARRRGGAPRPRARSDVPDQGARTARSRPGATPARGGRARRARPARRARRRGRAARSGRAMSSRSDPEELRGRQSLAPVSVPSGSDEHLGHHRFRRLPRRCRSRHRPRESAGPCARLEEAPACHVGSVGGRRLAEWAARRRCGAAG